MVSSSISESLKLSLAHGLPFRKAKMPPVALHWKLNQKNHRPRNNASNVWPATKGSPKENRSIAIRKDVTTLHQNLIDVASVDEIAADRTSYIAMSRAPTRGDREGGHKDLGT
jgi:hypothetical protein